MLVCARPLYYTTHGGISSKENKVPALIYYSNRKSNFKNKQVYGI